MGVELLVLFLLIVCGLWLFNGWELAVGLCCGLVGVYVVCTVLYLIFASIHNVLGPRVFG